jgi:8-oxo-dGTP pyrophosphatase MutT (NUDIX family)
VSGPDLRPGQLTAPRALLRLAEAAAQESAARFSAVPPPADGRESAVLVLFGPTPAHLRTLAAGDETLDDLKLAELELLVTQRAHTLRSHAAQPAFPGGRIDPGDDGAVGAALREAGEETGLDPGGVEVLATLPHLGVLPSRSVVVPVLGWWHTPSAVGAVDPAEVARVLPVPVSRLLDPDVRVRVVHPTGRLGRGFVVDELLIWGFTGGLVQGLLRVAEDLGLVPKVGWPARDVQLADYQELLRPGVPDNP